MSKTSVIWNYFEGNQKNKDLANCLVEEFSFPPISRGGKGNYSTSCLVQHLENNHPTEYEEYLKLKKESPKALTGGQVKK